MTHEAVSYVQFTPEGGWRIINSRISLDSIVHAYWNGSLPEAIAADFPPLSLEQVHGAIAFYLRNRQEIDEYLKSQNSRWEQFRKESEEKHSALLKRIRLQASTFIVKRSPSGWDA